MKPRDFTRLTQEEKLTTENTEKKITTKARCHALAKASNKENTKSEVVLSCPSWAFVSSW